MEALIIKLLGMILRSSKHYLGPHKTWHFILSPSEEISYGDFLLSPSKEINLGYGEETLEDFKNKIDD